MTDAELLELVAKAKARHDALSPVDQALEYVRQRQSWLRGEMALGLSDGKGMTPEQIAALPKDAAAVLADEVERLRAVLECAQQTTPGRQRHSGLLWDFGEM